MFIADFIGLLFVCFYYCRSNLDRNLSNGVKQNIWFALMCLAVLRMFSRAVGRNLGPRHVLCSA
jgi:hypothetical protein